MSLNTHKHTIGETIIGAWNHGGISMAVAQLLEPQRSYTVTESLPNGEVIKTVTAKGIEIKQRCNDLLGKYIRGYAITDTDKHVILRYIPGGNGAKSTIH